MKSITAIIVLSIGIASCKLSVSQPQKFIGVFNDVNSEESKMLYSCKIEVNEAYSDGNLFMYDMDRKTSTIIAKIKNMKYGTKSYFKDNDSILVVTNNEVFISSVNPNNKVRSIVELEKSVYIISSKKIDLNVFLILLDYNKSMLSLVELDHMTLKIKYLDSAKVNIIPTDNFFDLTAFKERSILFDNGKLFELKSNEKTDLSLKVAFNNSLGKYIMANSKNCICCVIEKIDGTQGVIFISENNIKTLPIKISKDYEDRISIEETKNNDNCFSLEVGNDVYTINRDGFFKKTTAKILFSGTKISVYKNNDYELEIK